MNNSKALFDCVAELENCFNSFIGLNPGYKYEGYWALSPRCNLAAAITASICLKHFNYPVLATEIEGHTVAQTIFGCIDGKVGGIWFDHLYQIDDSREPDIKFNNWNPNYYTWWWKPKKEIVNVMCYGLSIKHYADLQNVDMNKNPKKVILSLNKLFKGVKV
tara:strand:- start:17 stop:502 length:486 start_codon:yes stop_codon:yes gene_type:complete